ncbi:MAG: GldG family protein [Clostridiaceae bacterium]|jgi:ABC-2 type transport system permease protein|nr:GldG family protein [Clostridiaceae bacterium]
MLFKFENIIKSAADKESASLDNTTQTESVVDQDIAETAEAADAAAETPVTAEPESEIEDKPESEERKRSGRKAARKARGREVDKRNKRLGRFSTVTIIIVVAIVLVLNLVLEGVGQEWKWDWTANKSFTLDKASLELLNGLEDDVEIVILTTEDAFPGYLQRVSKVSLTFIPDLLNQYKLNSGGRLTIRYADIVRDPDLVKEIDPSGLQSLAEGNLVVKNKSNNRLKVVPAGSLVKYEFNQQYMQTIPVAYQAEAQISGAIKYVSTTDIPVVYFVSGHNETPVDEQYSLLNSLLVNNNFDVKNLNTSTGQPIPDDATVLVLFNPQYDISSDEVHSYKEYLDRGGSLFVTTEPNIQTFVNLNSLLLDVFNLQITGDRVREENQDWRLPRYNSNTGRAEYNDPYVFLATLERSSIYNDQIENALYMTGPSRSIIAGNNARDWITTETVIVTSPRGTLELDGDKERISDEGRQPIVMVSENVGRVDNKSVTKGARAVISGNDSWLTDSTLGLSPNIINTGTFYYAASWLGRSESTDTQMYIQTKPLVSYSINYSNTSVLNLVASLSALVIPLALLIIGLVVRSRRKRL